MVNERKAIALPEQVGGAVVPIDVEKLVALVDAFDKFKSMVLKESDFWIDTRENKRRVKKSGWLKYALACNVNLEKVEEREVDKELPPDSGNWVTIFHFDYRAIAPTGRYAEGSGSASTDERDDSGKMIHDTRSLAQTRAMNRAISHLVGGGEVSAEEVMGSNRKHVQSNQKPLKEPEKRQMSLGKVTAGTVTYNLKAVDIGGDSVTVTEDDDHVIVTPTRELTDEELYKISGALEDVGPQYQEEDPHGRWTIKRRD